MGQAALLLSSPVASHSWAPSHYSSTPVVMPSGQRHPVRNCLRAGAIAQLLQPYFALQNKAVHNLSALVH